MMTIYQAYDGPVFKENVDMSGKVVVITGANSGLGKESAVALAKLGAEVILLCRDPKKTEAAIKEIKERSNSEKVRSYYLDLGDLNTVSKCSEQLHKDLSKIDVLLNNAGLMAIPTREITAQGLEKQFGVNHIGHFSLTNKLFDLVEKSESGRIVTVSSYAHLLGKLDRNNLQLENEKSYEPWPAYGNSKLANILFTKSLASKLEKSNSKTVAVSLHPGVCRTELGRYIIDPDKLNSIPKILYPVLGIVGSPAVYFTKSSFMGAQTQIYLSASSNIDKSSSGQFFDNSKSSFVSSEAQDMEEANWLWSESERITGSKFSI